MGNPQTDEVAGSERRHRASGAHRRRRSRTLRRAPSRALPGTWRGSLWMLVVAADFFLMSNPLLFVVNFDAALRLAILFTVAAVVFTFPWVRTPRVAWPVVAYLGWALASYTWSIQPINTSEAWVQSAVVASAAVLVYTNVSPRVLITGFVLGGVAVSAASLYAFHDRLPGAYYETQLGPAIAGIGTNKNILAYTLTLSLCAVFAAVPRAGWARVAWLGSGGIIGYVLVETNSATGDLTAVAIVVTAVLVAGFRPVTRLLRTTSRRIAAGVSVAAAVASAFVLVKKALGEDLITYSDRSTTWAAAVEVVHNRPLQGFGWGAVWPHPWKPAPLNSVIAEIHERSGLPLTHGHNSAIDLVVEVGLVGVLLMVGLIVAAGSRFFPLMRASGADPVSHRIMAKFTALCLVNLVLFGVTEPLATIPLGWWALVLLTEPVAHRVAMYTERRKCHHDMACFADPGAPVGGQAGSDRDACGGGCEPN